MTRSKATRWFAMTLVMVAGMLGLAGAVGCEGDYVYAGDFYEPTVQPMDFSPYGYDYSFYDILTSDI